MTARFRSGPLVLAAGMSWAPLGAQAPADPDPEVAEALAALQEAFRARHPQDLQRLASLMNVSVVSASNRLEQWWGAPAQIQTITREDILLRGYRDLSEALDDLPGMDLARHYGDTNFKDYWRGYRNTHGDPYLVLVDGRIANDLWILQGQATLAAIPLSMIERLEVVYGPTSVLYGPNAMMGVLNIVTIRNQAQEGPRTWGSLGAGNLAFRSLDLTHFLKRGTWSLRLSAKLQDSRTDERNSGTYEYTRGSYRDDPRIWARGFLENGGLELRDPPPLRTRALEASFFGQDTEFGIRYLERDSGYALTYARDQMQPNGRWIDPLFEAHLRQTWTWRPDLEATTTLRWRQDGFPRRNWDLEAYYDPQQHSFLNRFSRWRTHNQEFSLKQDLDWWIDWRWSLNAGFQWEHRDLQRAYDADADFYPIDQAVIPPLLPERTSSGNRTQLKVWGAYVQARLRLEEGHLLHLGLRRDEHPVFGGTTHARMGYTGRIGALGLKLLYGEASQEPSPRTLYGGFLQAGSNPDLRPERSRTWEAVLSYGEGPLLQTLDVYHVRNRDTVTYLQNLGTRTVVGADYQVRASIPAPGLEELHLSFFHSRYFRADGEPAGDFGLTSDGRIGDLSRHKTWAELQARKGPFKASLRARYLGERPTVATNPLGRVPPQGTADLSMTWSLRRISLQASIQNLLDRSYFHPGIFRADAGAQPGSFIQDGQGTLHWLGSGGVYDSARGFYSSLLPQPGRTFQITLRFPS